MRKGAAFVAAAVIAEIAGTSAALAQADSALPSFDVASIKPSAARAGIEGGNRARIEHTPTSLSMFHVALADCVQWAYGVANFQLAAGNASAESYDIVAKTGSRLPVGELRLMLRDLLARRFQLAVHRETRMLPVYQLVVDKGGPKLPAAHTGGTVHAAETLPRIRNDSFVFTDVSMAEFAQMLSQLRGIELPVVDRTGITGTFEIALKSAPAAAREGDSAALFAILQEQVGLKLVSAKAPFEVIVIDHAGKPSAN
jgi:uncharacterized protein (TIGR03435 family)